ncbi:MAG: hypothetical protein ACREEM_29980, partial [Blastocatellia bacterium]
MQNIAIKVLLNNSICTALPVLPERGFSRVPATYLQQPDYRPEFFETLPTMWATAYIFQRAVEREDAELVEEWVSLLLLHSFGELNVKSFSKTKLKDEYDRDLWPALNGTYPNRRNDVLGGVRLLVRASGVVVGACYPGVIFFPGRDRAEWKEDENLRPYLDDDGQHLSWARCRDLLLPGMKERSGFHRRIQSIAGRLEGELRTALLNFCNRESCFKGIQLTDPLENLDGDLSRWIV